MCVVLGVDPWTGMPHLALCHLGIIPYRRRSLGGCSAAFWGCVLQAVAEFERGLHCWLAVGTAFHVGVCLGGDPSVLSIQYCLLLLNPRKCAMQEVSPTKVKHCACFMKPVETGVCVGNRIVGALKWNSLGYVC